MHVCFFICQSVLIYIRVSDIEFPSGTIVENAFLHVTAIGVGIPGALGAHVLGQNEERSK